MTASDLVLHYGRPGVCLEGRDIEDCRALAWQLERATRAKFLGVLASDQDQAAMIVDSCDGTALVSRKKAAIQVIGLRHHSPSKIDCRMAHIAQVRVGREWQPRSVYRPAEEDGIQHIHGSLRSNAGHAGHWQGIRAHWCLDPTQCWIARSRVRRVA